MKRYEAEVFLGDDKSGHWDSLDAYLCTDVDALLAQCEEALKASWEHHEYCGWGDAWEREVAEAQKLPDKMTAALAAIRAAREGT